MTVLLLLTLVLSSLTGCIAPLPYWTGIRYDLAGIEPLPNLEPVTLYQIEDRRLIIGTATRIVQRLGRQG
jgi:hypothetical protein